MEGKPAISAAFVHITYYVSGVEDFFSLWKPFTNFRLGKLLSKG